MMTNFSKNIFRATALAVIAATAVPAIAASGASSGISAQSPSVRKAMKIKPSYQILYRFDCAVAGTPVEFPDDVKIWETTGKSAPKGTKIKWTVRANNNQIIKSGYHTLAADLPAGKIAFLSNVLPYAMPAGKEACKTN